MRQKNYIKTIFSFLFLLLNLNSAFFAVSKDLLASPTAKTILDNENSQEPEQEILSEISFLDAIVNVHLQINFDTSSFECVCKFFSYIFCQNLIQSDSVFVHLLPYLQNLFQTSICSQAP
ncbi:MAG: hypothetical protein EAZ97_05220 [Bacteroidetes bacterium]|nr:MAG: hypothetical protein EAZ97_05220 [Bacteroidota bacterium]